jgi:hypothetical protein
MLADRRALLEHEIKKAHDEAAAMYLIIVIGGSDVHDPEYQVLKERVSSLQFDLNIVNRLIHNGSK